MAADLSDEDHDIDIESDDDDIGSPTGGLNFLSEADKKAHHNALERKRRDHIKESFTKLRDSIPETKKEKTSRALILKRATDYIKQTNQRNQTRQKEIEKMKRQNQILRQQLQAAEQAQANGSLILSNTYLPPGSLNHHHNDFDLSESEEEGSEENVDHTMTTTPSSNVNISNGYTRTSKRAKLRN